MLVKLFIVLSLIAFEAFDAVMHVTRFLKLSVLSSVPIELEKSLSSCLLALFSPKEGEPCAVLRLWSYLLTQLQLCLVNQVYPLMSSELQVCSCEGVCVYEEQYALYFFQYPLCTTGLCGRPASEVFPVCVRHQCV